MSTEKKVYPGERKKRRILVDLPEDIILMLDDCARAIAMTRSGFLQVYFDSYAEQVISFTEGWLKNIGFYYDKVKDRKRLEQLDLERRGLNK